MVSFTHTSASVFFRKLTFSDQPLSSTRRTAVSTVGLGIVLSFIVLSAVLFNTSSRGSFNPLLKGLSGFGNNRSLRPWSSSAAFSSSPNSVSALTNCNDTNGNNVQTGKSSDLPISGRKDDILEGALSNESVELASSAHFGNSAANSTNGSSLDRYARGHLDSDKIPYEECDIFNGRWVRDDTLPYYPPRSCPYIDKDFDCRLNGRPDSEYVKWKWQPYHCDIPRFNATDFLRRLSGQKLVFVGDSLNRNMWESLVCALRHGVEDKTRVYEISGRHEFKKKGFYAFRFEAWKNVITVVDYNCTVDFVSSPFLVMESSLERKNATLETLRLDAMDRTTSMYRDADVVVFNTGHWWTHEKTSRGEDYYQEGNFVHPRLKVMEAYKRALLTWAKWVDQNIDAEKTLVVFRGYSVTHFRGGPWNLGGQCSNETEPIFDEAHLAKYPTKMKIFERVLKEMKTQVAYLNISRLTDYRKDGHPSVYRPRSYEKGEIHAQDCSHWCLPGVPDTWNELLYASLLKSRRGSWNH